MKKAGARLAAGLFVVPLFSNCAHQETNGDFPPPEIPLHHVPVTQFSQVAAKRIRSVIRTEDEWRALWDKMGMPEQGVVQIDFDRSVVAIASLGPHEIRGTTISIMRAYEASGVLVLHVTEVVPGENCTMATVQSFPVSMMSVPTRLRRVRWVEDNEIDPCE